MGNAIEHYNKVLEQHIHDSMSMRERKNYNTWMYIHVIKYFFLLLGYPVVSFMGGSLSIYSTFRIRDV